MTPRPVDDGEEGESEECSDCDSDERPEEQLSLLLSREGLHLCMRGILYPVEWRWSLLARLRIIPVAELIVDVGREVGGEASIVLRLHSGLWVVKMGVHEDDFLELFGRVG